MGRRIEWIQPQKRKDLRVGEKGRHRHTLCHSMPHFCGTQDILLQHKVRELIKWGQIADICLGRKPNGQDTAADRHWLIYSNNKANTYFLEELGSRICSDFKQIRPKGLGLKENKKMPTAQQAGVVQKLSFEGGAGPGPLHRIAVNINSKYTSSWKQWEKVPFFFFFFLMVIPN